VKSVSGRKGIIFRRVSQENYWWERSKLMASKPDIAAVLLLNPR